MRYGLSVPNFGPYHQPKDMAKLALHAEESGWDGFFLWDHIMAGSIPVCDPWIALAAIAMRTERIKLGPLVTPLPRRRPHKLAREVVSIDQLSGGRLILGVGIGSGPWEWEYLGEEIDMRLRGDMLDEALEVLAKAWSGQPFSFNGNYYKVKGDLAGSAAQFLPTPIQKHIPIWVGGVWPNKRPFRRAARFDGMIPIKDLMGNMLNLEELKEAIKFVKAQRQPEEPFEVVVAGRTQDPFDIEKVKLYAKVGATWWLETIDPISFGWQFEGELPIGAIETRVREGPPMV